MLPAAGSEQTSLDPKLLHTADSHSVCRPACKRSTHWPTDTLADFIHAHCCSLRLAGYDRSLLALICSSQSSQSVMPQPTGQPRYSETVQPGRSTLLQLHMSPRASRHHAGSTISNCHA
jgi:hypothetical protein